MKEESLKRIFCGMTEEDLERILQIEQENFSIPWTKAGFLDAMSLQNNLFMLVWEDGQVLGYCGAYIICPEAEITNVSVAKAFQNKGVGFWMMQQFLQLLAQKQVEAVTLEVRKSNASAIHLYEKLGFRKEAVRPHYYQKPTEDAIIMWKR